MTKKGKKDLVVVVRSKRLFKREFVRYEIDPLFFGEARIIETDGSFVFRAWYYATRFEALYAWFIWSKLRRTLIVPEPTGWYRAIDVRGIYRTRSGYETLDLVRHHAGGLMQGSSIYERRCRDCGCTDEEGCPGGCFWVEDDLCSQCASKPDPFIDPVVIGTTRFTDWDAWDNEEEE